MEDIRRIINVRTKKQACGNLLEKRSVGDDLWHQLLLAEKEMEVELKDIVKEVRSRPQKTTEGILIVYP